MDNTLKVNFKKRYHLGHKIKYSIDSQRVKYTVTNFQKKFNPVNSSLSTSAMNSDLDKAQEHLAIKKYHFDRSIELELSKLHNKFFVNPKTKRNRTLEVVTSLTPAPDLLITPLKKKNPHMRNPRIFKSFDNERPKTPQIAHLKSTPMHLDPNLKFKKIRKQRKSTDMRKIDKVITDCSFEQEDDNKIVLKYLENWVGAKTFDNDRLYEKRLTKRLIENNSIHSQLTVSAKNNKKLWKQNHHGFIAQVNKEIYSVRSIL